MRFRGNIADDPMVFNQDLGCIWDKPSSISESKPIIDPTIHDLLVLLIFGNCSQIARAEHFGFGFDDQVFV